MKPRFDENQPWFFGWLPSEYMETLSEEARGALQLRHTELATLDRYQALANACPSTRTVRNEAQFLAALSGSLGALPDIGVEDWLEIASLAVSYCKPFTEMGLWEPAERTTAVLDAYGLRTRVVDRHRGRALVYIGYSDEIIDAYMDCENAFFEGKLTLDERSLINGILFGYPLGDVFGFCLGNSNDPWYLGLVHHPHSRYWSEQWRNDIGFRGLEHLVQVYRAQSPLHLGYLELQSRNGSIILHDPYTLEVVSRNASPHSPTRTTGS